MENILISLPGLYLYSGLNLKVLELMETMPECFNSDIKIDSVYGCFPCIWNGGRIYEFKEVSIEDIKAAVTFLNSRGIRVRYTFTNINIDEDMVHDTVGNMILKATVECQTLKNDINVENDVIRNYIEERYPDKFNFVYSTTKCIKEVEDINRITENNILVPDYSVNNDFEKLEKLAHPENVEILVNETCIDDCPFRRLHYEAYSDYISKKDDELMQCAFPAKTNGNYYTATCTRKRHVTLPDIRSKYLPLGINKFKIVGRGVPIFNTIEGYLEYLVKPEYRDYIRIELLRSVFGV